MAAPGGKAPFGFQWRGEELVVCEREAAIRRRAFELFVEFERKGTVARKLNEESHPSPGGSKWSDVAVKRTLECESARGRYATNKTAMKAGKRIQLPEEEWDVIPCPAIVSDETWGRAQEILNSQKRGGGRAARPPRQLFSGLAVCECGEKMRVPGNTGKYVCGSCGNKVPCADLERMFELEFRESLLPVFQGVDSSGENVALQRRAELRERMANLEELFASKAITLERFTQRQRELEDEERALPSDPPTPSESSKSSEPGVDLEGFLERWSGFPFDEQLKIVQLLVGEVTVCRDHVEFAFRIPDSLKDAPTNQQTPAPTHAPTDASGEPVYIRLPKQGELCPLSGLSRAKLNELILPNARNNQRPPVKSKSLRKKGSLRGTRLILRQSLLDYLASQPNG